MLATPYPPRSPLNDFIDNKLGVFHRVHPVVPIVSLGSTDEYRLDAFIKRLWGEPELTKIGLASRLDDTCDDGQHADTKGGELETQGVGYNL